MSSLERAPPEWYRDAVVYSVDVKTFYDADGDGWGDFEGLTERVGYIDTLGADCIWLRPFYPSPLRDNGYDVADYYAVDDRLGTLGDFREFVEVAADHGIRVLVDVVFNHTSNEHDWFQRARRDPDSGYHDYYLWTSHVEDAYSTGNIFPEYEDGVWTYDDEAGKHYFHQFYSHQPDLNVANPAVQRELRRILEFWLDQGVDGFRVDAAHPMQLPKGHHGHRLEDPLDLFRDLRQAVREKNPEAILLAEADDDPENLPWYFGDHDGDAFDMLFDFVTNAHMAYAVGVKDTWPLHRAFDKRPDTDHGWWANFLRNHDEWNLLKLPWEALHHARSFFGDDDGSSWIFGRGHRLRLADLYVGDHDRIALAHSLLFAFPGTPVLLAGDEIGMGADLSLPEREAVRTPMQWDATAQGGFTTGDDPYNPVVDEGPYSYEAINVADQLPDPDSLLSRVRRLVDARQLCTEISSGDHTAVPVEPREVWVSRVDEGRTTLLTAHNTADEERAVTVGFDAPDHATVRVVGTADYEISEGTCTLRLDACEYAWLRGDRRGERVPLGRP